jgi:hypothetical protein
VAGVARADVLVEVAMKLLDVARFDASVLWINATWRSVSRPDGFC